VAAFIFAKKNIRVTEYKDKGGTVTAVWSRYRGSGPEVRDGRQVALLKRGQPPVSFTVDVWRDAHNGFPQKSVPRPAARWGWSVMPYAGT
jgi:hypothetical protein